jgi:hypothetical protein
MQLNVLLGGQLPSSENDHRYVGEISVLADALQHLEPGHVGQPKIEDHAVAGLICHGGQSSRSAVGNDNLQIVVREELFDAELLGGVVLDHQQPLTAWRRVGFYPSNRSFEAFGGGRLVDE